LNDNSDFQIIPSLTLTSMTRTTTLHLIGAQKGKLGTQSAHEKLKLAAVAATLAVIAVLDNTGTPSPCPKRTSILIGALWIRELLGGHPGQFQEQMGLSRTVFCKLSHKLQMTGYLRDGQSLSVDEQLGIFLHFFRTGLTSNMLHVME
jgi:hypothetical protein